MHGIQQGVFVQTVQNGRHLMHIALAVGLRVLVCRQVEHAEPVEHQPDHHPLERVFDPLFGFVPPAAYLDRRLSVEHAELVSCQHKTLR